MRLDLSFSKDSARYSIVALSALTFALTVAVGGYFSYLDRGIRDSNQATHIYVDDVTSITDALSNLRDAIGYGGFIHHFKNYVIRRDDRYAELADAEMKHALTLVEKLSNAFLDGGAAVHLFTVQAMIQEYQRNLAFAVGEGKDLPIAELDTLVKVDDGPAVKALSELDKIRARRLARDVEIGDASANHLAVASEFGIFFVALIVLFGGVTLWVVLRSNKKLRLALNEIDVLIEGAPNAILCIDEEGIIQRCNEDACALFGYPQEDLTGLHVDKLVPQEVNAEHRAFRENFLQNPHSGPMTNREGLKAVSRDGREIPVEIDLSVVKQNEGQQVVAFVRDVSLLQQKKMELQEANKKALEAIDAKSQFMATMSHELRTPLNAVIGFSELLQMKAEKGATQEELANYGRSIGRSGKDLLTLINDILDFAKIDSGNFEISEAPFYLSEVIGNIHSGFEARAVELGVDLQSKIESMNNVVLGDQMRIKQVLYNLLDNAIKFGRGGVVNFAARAIPQKNSKLVLEVAITDHGIGIDPVRLETIFDPFHQADASIAREFGGTGLGLSISRSLARLLGGDITVRSELGKGSTFKASFMLQDLKALNPQTLSQALRKADEQDNDFGLTILAVDDVEPNLDVVENVLTDMGCIVIKARNGEEAVKWCQSYRPDAILMDIHMPIMNGLDAAANIIKTVGIDNAPPVFAWTADVTCGELLKQSKTPWQGIITKPTVRNDLILAMRQVAANGQ
ncbi:PAS domain S-box protein [Hwanghaeella grinnelliae]|uniref:histidine kinase n=1 Tax=Hwanghaeella grinnelliae TaxID=2500179 RepID=A0A437QXM8_9PROT|nr:ATP-binding protein [Hwanghaeella grinnelliae]RVU39280.1 PAS domain S-box protein [Hwanghaeella grinnelliae]